MPLHPRTPLIDLASLRRAAVAVATASILLASCSSDSDPEADADQTTQATEVVTTALEASLADWQAQTTAVCEEYEPRQAAISGEAGEPQTLEELVALFDALTPLVDEYIQALNAIPVPTERADDIRRTYELNSANGASAAEARTAAAAGDESGVTAAVNELSAQGRELEQLLGDLDVPACITTGS